MSGDSSKVLLTRPDEVTAAGMEAAAAVRPPESETGVVKPAAEMTAGGSEEGSGAPFEPKLATAATLFKESDACA